MQMAGDINIGTVNIGTMQVGPEGLGDFLQAQVDAGADPEIMKDTGYTEVPEPSEPEPAPTPDEQAEIDQDRAERIDDMITDEMIAAFMRSDSLHLLIKEVDRSRNMEGFQENHERQPNNSWKVGRIRVKEHLKAEETLARACSYCLFQNSCWLRENLPGWLDVHPYKEGHRGQRRPGSKYVKEVESRLDFIDVIREDPQAHCDPAKREKAARQLAKEATKRESKS